MDEFVRLGAQAIIVPAMDVEQWGSREHELNARMARVRSAEYGVEIFRVTSSGVSQLTDVSGRERERRFEHDRGDEADQHRPVWPGVGADAANEGAVDGLTAPCVLVFEDLETIVTDQNRSYFLNELDGFAANEGVVIAAGEGGKWKAAIQTMATPRKASMASKRGVAGMARV